MSPKSNLYTTPSKGSSQRSQRGTSPSPSPATPSIGSTSEWERKPATYGLSSVRARAAKMVGRAGDGAAFVRSHQQRHGLHELLQAYAEASEGARLEAMRELLKGQGVDANKAVKVEWRPFRTTALFEAAVNGERELAKLLLDHGALPDTQVGPGLTALYNAALNGHAEVVRLLCERGADVGATTVDGLTPLYASCQHGHTSCVDELLKASTMTTAVANLPLPSRHGGATALYIAAQGGHYKSVGRLLRYTVDPDASADGSTPLMISLYMAARQAEPRAPAADGREVAEEMGNHLRCVHGLIRGGASLSAKDAHGRSALDWAPAEWHEALMACARGGGGDADAMVGRVAKMVAVQREAAAAVADAVHSRHAASSHSDVRRFGSPSSHSHGGGGGAATSLGLGAPQVSFGERLLDCFGIMGATQSCLHWAFVDTGSPYQSPASTPKA